MRRPLRLGAVIVAGAVLVTTAVAVLQPEGAASNDGAASTPTPASITPRTQPAATLPQAETAGANPVIRRVPREQWDRIVRTGTWRPGCPVGRKALRRLEVSFVDFQGRVQRGALVAHRDTVGDLAEIFTWMFDNRFPIARMQPVEEFGGDVDVSLAANNTSAFNCRKPGQINAPVRLSPHANGRAIDINPVQNPWRDLRCDCWKPSREFKGPRAEGAGVIREGSPVIRQFVDRGWVWQNIKVPDYMHFDTGYPSEPRATATAR